MPVYFAKRRILKSVPSFSPASIRLMAAWLDAQTLSTSNGASVTSWSSTLPGTVTATASTAPTMALNVTSNGKKALLFTAASSQTMSTTYGAVLNDFSVAIVFRDNATPLAGRIVDKSYGGGFWTGRNATVVSNTWGGGIEEGVDPYGNYLTAQAGKFNILTLDRLGTTKTIWMNGPSLNSVSTVSSAATNSTTLTISSDGVGGSFFDGYIAEIILYEKAFTYAERLNIHLYLATKYGISIS